MVIVERSVLHTQRVTTKSPREGKTAIAGCVLTTVRIDTRPVGRRQPGSRAPRPSEHPRRARRTVVSRSGRTRCDLFPEVRIAIRGRPGCARDFHHGPIASSVARLGTISGSQVRRPAFTLARPWWHRRSGIRARRRVSSAAVGSPATGTNGQAGPVEPTERKGGSWHRTSAWRSTAAPAA